MFYHFHPGYRFRKPITTFECETFGQSWISNASLRKWDWALKTFEQWRADRNHSISNNSYSGEPLMNARLEDMSEDQLEFLLPSFHAEVRKVEGKEYLAGRLYVEC